MYFKKVTVIADFKISNNNDKNNSNSDQFIRCKT